MTQATNILIRILVQSFINWKEYLNICEILLAIFVNNLPPMPKWNFRYIVKFVILINAHCANLIKEIENL